MVSFLGWVLVIAAVALVISAFRRPENAPGPDPAEGRYLNRPYLWSGVISLALGILLALWPTIAMAHLSPVDLTHRYVWDTNPAISTDGTIHWDGNALVADLEAGSGRYAAYPVDWEADRFEASWDITFTLLDRTGDKIPLKIDGKTVTHERTPLDFASVTVGIMDQNTANVDDRDHVSGSAIEACFSDDIRLRASDANFMVRTSSSDESGKAEIDPDFKKTPPIVIELNKKYHCRLAYSRGTGDATLTVEDDRGRQLCFRKIEDLRDFTNSLAWFGASIRGYNRFDKKLDPKKADTGYTRPRAVIRLENMQYAQP